MSQKKLEQVVKDKGFRPFDLLIYGGIAVLVLVLFLTLVVFRENKSLHGVQITYRGEQVFIYRFSDDEAVVLSQTIEILSNDGSLLKLIVHTPNDGYNEIEIDKTNKTVRVVDANCSWRKDCTHMSALDGDGATPISCVPHSVMIVPLGYDIDDGTIVG